jgi:hypothetical protein
MRHKTARSALSVVSYLFLLVGLIAFVEMVGHIVGGYFHFTCGLFGILGIGIFAGLRRYSRAWRICALVFTWYGIITLSVALFICLNGQPPSSNLMPFSHRLSNVPANLLSIPLAMVLMVTLWQYRVLTHPAIRRLFNEEPRPSHEPEPASVGPEIDGAVLK